MEAVRTIETHVPPPPPTTAHGTNSNHTNITAAHLHVGQHMWSNTSTSPSVVTKDRDMQMSVLTVSTQCVRPPCPCPPARSTDTHCLPSAQLERPLSLSRPSSCASYNTWNGKPLLIRQIRGFIGAVRCEVMTSYCLCLWTDPVK